MIRNQYNILTPSAQDTKGKEEPHLKQWHHNQNTVSLKPNGQFPSLLPPPSAPSPHLPQHTHRLNGFLTFHQDIHAHANMQRHTKIEIVNRSRSSALELSVKPYWGGVL